MSKNVCWVTCACCAWIAPAALGLSQTPQDVLVGVNQPFDSIHRLGPSEVGVPAPADATGPSAGHSPGVPGPTAAPGGDMGGGTEVSAPPCRAEELELEFQWPDGAELAGLPKGSTTAGCSLALMGTCRVAESDQIKVTSCVPCDCPPFGQNNFKLKQTVTTPFLMACNCDELAMVGFPRSMAIVWTFQQKEVRRAGPCDAPIGSYAGKFVLLNTDNNQPLIRGKFLGTLGWDQAHPTCPCQAFPRVIGTMSGKAVPGLPIAGCKVRWIFQGQERYLTPDLCRPVGWDVNVYGMAICPCP
ncbi:MAG: hypothetical protein C4547_05350 [Phycisphaerales bacterium]|nr:MAG: hypothetical protein C4547_05350 [Phycisphaerales bacterium]